MCVVVAETLAQLTLSMNTFALMMLPNAFAGHKVQGMTEAFTYTLYSRAKTSSSVRQKAVFTAFLERDSGYICQGLCYRKKLPSCPARCAAHLHRQNQVAHALRTRDFWLASLSMHFPIHFTRHAHEYPVTLSQICDIIQQVVDEQIGPLRSCGTR